MTSLAPAARTWRGWVQAVRRRPWPIVRLVGGYVAANLVLEQFDSGIADSAQTATIVVVIMSLTPTRAALLRGVGPGTDAGPVVSPRPPVDARTTAAVRPVWRWWSPLGRAAAAAALAAGAVAVGSGLLVVDAVRDGSGGALLAAALLTLVGLVALSGLWMALVETPAECRHVVRQGTPSPVRVLGIEHDAQRWHLQPEDGGDVVVVDACRGRSRLVADDVVLLWQATGRANAVRRRVALTGPFGTLWPEPHEPAVARADDEGTSVRG